MCVLRIGLNSCIYIISILVWWQQDKVVRHSKLCLIFVPISFYPSLEASVQTLLTEYFFVFLAKDVSSILSSFEANLKKEFNLDVVKLSSDSAGKLISRNQSSIQYLKENVGPENSNPPWFLYKICWPSSSLRFFNVFLTGHQCVVEPIMNWVYQHLDNSLI